MELNECTKPFELVSWVEKRFAENPKMLHVYLLEAVWHAHTLGQKSFALPVVTVGDDVTDKLDRRKTPRGDAARGLVDAALAGGDVQEID